MDIYRLPFLSRTLFLDDPFMIGGDVKLVQERLLALGYTEVGVVDSLFGAWTEAAVKAFQADNDLVVDGVVNPATWDVLFQLTE